MSGTLLALRGIGKQFNGKHALRGVDLVCGRGEILALLGENGAGKSTLMEIVGGALAPDRGEVEWKGEAQRWRSPAQARRAGISMVHQHFMLVPTANAAENIALARGRTGLLARRRLEAETRELAASLGLELPDTRSPVEDLSVGEQQRVEILKALDPPPDLLILDEPTAVLTPEEASGLFVILRKLAAGGTGIIIVTHKLPEALALADRVLVLRRGARVAEGPASTYDEKSLATAMVGEAPPQETRPPRPEPGAVVLQADDIHLRDVRGREVLRGISLGVREREIFAVAGAWGNGQEELLASFCGMPVGALQGEVRLADRKIDNAAAARRAGLAVIPADRRKEGLIAGLPLRENLLLSIDELEDATQWGRLRVAELDAQAQTRLHEFDVRPDDPHADAASLSGGNQQRLILGRELARRRRVAVLAANPTRGLDIEAARQVHIRLRAVAAAGAAVLIFSTDLDEIEALGDRVAVLYEGHLHEVASRSREEIGRLMAGLGAEA